MSGTQQYIYTIFGVVFEHSAHPASAGGELSGTITVTYSGVALQSVDAIDLTTTDYDIYQGYHYVLNGIGDTVFAPSLNETVGPYGITIYGIGGVNHTLDLSWSSVTPTALADTVAETTTLGGRTVSSTGESTYGGITYEPACFAAGTRLLTKRGEVPVEALGVGDRLPTLFSRRLAPVKWIGTRTLDAARHPRPWDVAPVRLHADAFSPGQPARDLLLSPDHGVLVDDVLIPVRYLLNGATITQEPAGVVTYFHVELDSHDVVFAEGLPSETYLDTGNRAAFENADGATMMTPAFARAAWAANGCASLVTEGPVLVAIRQRLLDRAETMGHTRTTDAALVVLADGTAVAGSVNGRHWRFELPSGTRQVRIRSRHTVPAEVNADNSDARRLGVAVAGLTLDGQAATDAAHLSGWQPPESGWRWTNGDATLDVQGARLLAFSVVLSPVYWVSATRQSARLAA